MGWGWGFGGDAGGSDAFGIGQSAATYLLRAPFTAGDQSFVNAQAADTPAEGVLDGSLTFTLDGNSQASIVGNALSVSATVAPAATATGILSNGITRQLGQAIMWRSNLGGDTIGTGVHNAAAIPNVLSVYYCYYGNNSIIYVNGGLQNPYRAVIGAWDDYCVILGGYSASRVPWRNGETAASYLYGASFYRRKNGESDWKLWHRNSSGNTATMYWCMCTRDTDEVRFDDILAPETLHSELLNPTAYSATPAGSYTFSHSADFWLEFEADTLPAAGQIEVRFRIQDASNYWQITIDSAGNIDLDEIVATAATQRGTWAGVANGSIIAILADDDDIWVLNNGRRRINYAAATNFKTATSGELETLGTGGVVKEMANWPRGTDL